MHDVELNHLIKMLNQLADNLTQGDPQDIAAERVADHVRRFWAPAMKERIRQYVDSGGEDLSPVAIKGIKGVSRAKGSE